MEAFSNKDGTEVQVKIKLRFLDSCRFMSCSIEKLSKTLTTDQMPHKGIFRYEYMNKWEQLIGSELLSTAFSILYNAHITIDEY